MEKAEEAKKSIREMVKYLISTDDKDVIESYSCTFDDIMESYAKEYAKQATKELREAITLKHAPDIKQREYIHSPAEEISIILDKYEASCPLERQEIIDEINARFIDIMNKP